MTAVVTGDVEPRFSIIIPAHNEEDRIAKTLDDFAETFSDSEIVVVLNGCTDGTREVVDRFRSSRDNVFAIEIPDAVGKGGAVRAGFLTARASIVGYVDADGATPAAEMRRLCEAIGDDDGVIGSRWLPTSTVAVKQPWKRRVASRSFNKLVRLFFGLRYADTQCGAKVFRREALQTVMRDVETSNLAFDVDLLFAMKLRGMRVREEPTYWIDIHGSRVQLVSASLKMFAALMRLRLMHSFFAVVLPMYDRIFPTQPLKARDRLRILVINWRDPKHPQAGGAEAYLFEQARRWAQWGHHVEWLSAGFPGSTPHDEIESICVRRVGNAMTVYFAVPWTYLREFRDRFDVILDSSNGIPFFSPLFSMKPKVCIVNHVHREVFKNHLPRWLAMVLSFCEEKLVPMIYRNVHFVTISEDTLAEMRQFGIGNSAAGLVRCGVDKTLVPGKKAAVPTVLYLGRLKAYKRVDVLVDEFAKVRSRMPDAVLRIAGTGDSRPGLEDRVRQRHLEDAVFFEGFVDEDRKRELLQGAWVTVTLSEMEGWGIGAIEGNACGTPAIAYDVPGLREAIAHDRSGLIVADGGDAAAAILSVLADGALRARLERGALARAAEFSWDRTAREMLFEIMRAIVGLEFRVVDLDGRWSFFGATAEAYASGVFDTRFIRS
ncbi:MAG TPA: glycosyltransferase [Candidatus Baltobacteraceae bacterium]|nr:glycosyltransferase [Candidatus Baltobacteraceae bacterium]